MGIRGYRHLSIAQTSARYRYRYRSCLRLIICFLEAKKQKQIVRRTVTVLQSFDTLIIMIRLIDQLVSVYKIRKTQSHV